MNTVLRSNTFTSATAQQICLLLDRKIGLNSVGQLEIAHELEALGFYSHDFADGLPNYDPWLGMTFYNFDWLVDDGRILIVDDK